MLSDPRGAVCSVYSTEGLRASPGRTGRLAGRGTRVGSRECVDPVLSASRCGLGAAVFRDYCCVWMITGVAFCIIARELETLAGVSVGSAAGPLTRPRLPRTGFPRLRTEYAPLGKKYSPQVTSPFSLFFALARVYCLMIQTITGDLRKLQGKAILEQLQPYLRLIEELVILGISYDTQARRYSDTTVGAGAVGADVVGTGVVGPRW